jgi:kinesin family protein 3/17
LQALAAQAEKEKQEQAELQSKIAAMESKVLHGGVNLLDKVDELKARSNATKQELEVRRRQQEEQQRQLEQLQVVQLDLSKKYSSLEVSRSL